MSFTTNYFKCSNNIFNLKLKPNQFTILSYLVRMANGSNSCFPSMNNISTMCCVSKSTVSATINELKRIGYIEVKSDGKKNIYVILYAKIDETNNRSSEGNKDQIIQNEQETKNIKKEAQCIELDVITKLVNETGAERKRVIEAMNYARSKKAKNIYAYAKSSIEGGWNDKVDHGNKFNNFQQRSYTQNDYFMIEKKLLGRI